MFMPMMDIRIMRVVVIEFVVLVHGHVRMGSAVCFVCWMNMLMVSLMLVPVVMGHRSMHVHVSVLFRQVQPKADAHQGRCRHEGRGKLFAEQRQSHGRTDKRGAREVRPCACRAQMPQTEDEQHQTEAVADQSQAAGGYYRSKVRPRRTRGV